MTANKVFVEKKPAVTQKSGHEALATADVCLTPVGAGMVPMPYPNRAPASALQHGSTHVRMGGSSVMLKGSQLRPSSGNEAGTGGGILSRITRGPAEVLQASMCVTIEGAHVARAGDITWHNGKNTIGTLK